MYVLLLRWNGFDDFGRVAGDDGVGRHIFGDYGCSGYHCILADRHARQDSCPGTHPSILTDTHGLADEYLALVEVVVIADELHVRRNTRNSSILQTVN